MADEKKIRLGIDAQEFDSKFERIRARAADMARDITNSSKEEAKNASEALRIINEQVKALKERNVLESQQRISNLDSLADRGKINATQRTLELAGIRADDKEAKTAIQLLEQLLATSKQQLVNDVKSENEAKANANKSKQAGLGVAGTVAGSSDVYSGAINASSSLINSLGAGLLAGGVLTIVAGLAVKAIATSMPYQQKMMQSAGIMGGSYGDYKASNMSAYGYTADQVIARQNEIALSNLTGKGSKAEGDLSLKMGRYFSIDGGEINQIERLNRNRTDSGDIEQTMQRMFLTLRSVGIIQGDDATPMKEYLQTLVQLSNQQVSLLGETNVGINTKMIAAISEMDKDFKNPVVLQRLISNLRSGLSHSDNPQMEALQYQTLAQLHPNASMFGLMKDREHPFMKGNTGYLMAYMSNLKKMSGGNDETFFMSLMSAFHLSATMAEKLGKGFLKSGSQEDFNKVIETYYDKDGNLKVKNLDKKTEDKTPALIVSMSNLTTAFQTNGKNLTEAMNKLVKIMSGDKKETPLNHAASLATPTGVAEELVSNTKFIDLMVKINDWWDKVSTIDYHSDYARPVDPK